MLAVVRQKVARREARALDGRAPHAGEEEIMVGVPLADGDLIDLGEGVTVEFRVR